MCLNSNCYIVITFGISMSKVTAPQDAHKRLVLQVYLGSDVLYRGKMFVRKKKIMLLGYKT